MGLEEVAEALYASASDILNIKNDFSGAGSWSVEGVNLYPIVDGQKWHIAIIPLTRKKADTVRIEAPGFFGQIDRKKEGIRVEAYPHDFVEENIQKADKEISRAIPLYMTLISAYEQLGELARQSPLWQRALLMWADNIHFNGQVNGSDAKVYYSYRSFFPDGANERAVEVSIGGRTMHANLDYFSTERCSAEELFQIAKHMRRTPDTIETQFRNYLSMKTALYRMGIPRLVPFLEKMYVNVDTQFRAGPMKTV